MLTYSETHIVALETDFQLKILVKREDQNHPFVSGNKWWKLKYNVEEAKKRAHHTLLTFGGAYSNHIYATAAAARELGFKSIGVIRGEKTDPLNATLSFAESCGMKLHFISREEYRKKTSKESVEELHARFGNFYLLPEGGTNSLAVRGCAEFAREKILPTECDYVCLPVGTGGTMAGIISGLGDKAKVIGFPVLKNATFLKDEIKQLLPAFQRCHWELQTDYHFGGYAKTTAELFQFVDEMKRKNLPLDHVYTAKMLFGIFHLAKKGFFPKGSTILAIHTGGLQGAIQ